MRKFAGIALVCCLMCGVAAAESTQPPVGSTAPALHFTELWQAPAGAKTDWAALQGKVVVLEFWATWCGPCVASIPHLNELAAAVDPSKVQFISIDDEDPKVVQNFLSKRKMAGWVAFDTSGRMFKEYRAGGRPTTVIVDTKGKIVAYTQPQDVTADKLQALAAGKKVSFTNFGKLIADQSRRVSTAESSSDPLFLLELTKVQAGTKGGGIFGPRGKFVMFAVEPKGLIAFAFHVPDDRVILKTQLPNDRYRFQGAFGDAPDSTTRPLLEAAVTAGLHIRGEKKNVTRKAYVLRATSQSRKLLVPSVPNAGAMQGYWNGKIHNIGGSMDELASSVESAIEQPVINETGITGKYDAELEIPDGDVAAAKSALAKVMGLDLVEEERSVPVIEVNALPSDDAKAAH